MLKTLKQARAVFGLLHPEEMRQRAERDIHIGLVASTGSGYTRLENVLAPAELPREARAQILRLVHRASDASVPPQVDVVIYEPGLTAHSGAYVMAREAPQETLRQILRDHEDVGLALARHFPGFRQIVIDRTIQAVARENALFAIATALPDVVPSLVELPWAIGEFASDTIFLTANQIRMAFLIAAACGVEVGFAAQKVALATIVAGAFGWRALARELVGKIPLGGGLIPKGGIAYAATFLIGKALERLYLNQPFTAEEHAALQEAAREEGMAVARELRKEV